MSITLLYFPVGFVEIFVAVGKTFGELIRAAREAAGLTQAALSKTIGASPGYVSQLETGFRTGVTGETLVRLCAALKVPQDHFGPSLAPGVTIPPPPPGPDRKLPFNGDVSCGPPGESSPVLEWMRVSADAFVEGRYVLRAVGNSMIDFGITPGTFIVVMPCDEAENGQDVLAQVDGEFTLKRFVVRGRGDKREMLLMGSGDAKPIRIREGADVKILGVVKHSFRTHK